MFFDNKSPRELSDLAIKFLEDCPSDAYPSEQVCFIFRLGEELGRALSQISRDADVAEKYRIITDLMECEMKGREPESKEFAIPVFFEEWAEFRMAQEPFLIDSLQYLKSNEFIDRCGLVQLPIPLYHLFSKDPKIQKIIRRMKKDDPTEAFKDLDQFVESLEIDDGERLKWDESLAAIAFCLEGYPPSQAEDILYTIAAMRNSVAAKRVARLCLANRYNQNPKFSP